MDDRLKVISGAQPGVERVALDVALELGLPRGGWCAAGRQADDGPIPDGYPVIECRAVEPHVRTQRNVETSSATLVFTVGTPTGATRYAIEVARSMFRPCLVLDLADAQIDPVAALYAWLVERAPRVLHVTGPREQGAPGLAARAREVLRYALATYVDATRALADGADDHAHLLATDASSSAPPMLA